MRCFAVALGMSATAVPYAHAQYGQAPQANAFGNGFLTATGGNPYAPPQNAPMHSQTQGRQQVADRWNSFNIPAQQQQSQQQQYSSAPQQQRPYNVAPGRQVFRQVSQQDDLLLPPRTSPASGPEQIGPGVAEPMPFSQKQVQQQVPARGSYEPAPANQRGPAYESSPSDRPAPAYENAPSRQQAPAHSPAPYSPAPSPVQQHAPSYTPQSDPYSNAPSVNYAPTESTILEPSHGMAGSSSYYPVNPYANQYSGSYSTAMNAPWDEGCGTEVPVSVFSESIAATRPALFPWFGGANALFLKTVNSSHHALAIQDGYPAIYANQLNPAASTGYELFGGRYLKCGTYGIGVGYFNYDPGVESVIITGMPGAPDTPGPGTNGDVRAAMQGYHDYHLDIDNAGPGTVDQVYNYISGASGQSAGAANVRATRDLDIQGLDVSLFSFGLMGYGRTTPMNCSSGCGSYGSSGSCNCGSSSCGSSCGSSGGHGGFGGLRGRGFGRLGGPLTRPFANRIQIVTSHGLRWFQIRDDAELAYNIDGLAGYQAQDIYDNVNISNDLYGYQFGGLLNYCISQNMNLNIGGKFGVYANDVEADRRVGTQTQTAYRFGNTNDLAQTMYDDVVLATLGEVNLGLGYRIGNAWTINGGYRVMGVSGIATAFDQMSQDFGTSLRPGHIHANDSLILHGAYVGANFNW